MLVSQVVRIVTGLMHSYRVLRRMVAQKPLSCCVGLMEDGHAQVVDGKIDLLARVHLRYAFAYAAFRIGVESIMPSSDASSLP